MGATEKGEHCAGFWYDVSKPTTCPFSTSTLTCYYFYFNSKFQPAKDSLGKCETGTALPSASLRGHSHALSRSPDAPTNAYAIQKAFHIAPGKSLLYTKGSFRGNYSTA